MERILLVDDEAQLTDLLDQTLSDEGYRTIKASRGEEALKRIAEEGFDLVLSDMMMPGMSGLDLLRQARKVRPDLAFILMTAYGNIEGAVQAIQEGAADYITKPFPLKFLKETVRRALDRRLHREPAGKPAGQEEFVTQDPSMKSLLATVEKAAAVGAPLLIQGETGTGKERVARHFYARFGKKDGRFVAINCAAIPKDLLESELFGHERGAFTGAQERKIGKFEAANGGVLFLDEVGEMPLEVQAKLLRVLQEKEFCRVGGNDLVRMSSYVVAATNRDLKEMVASGRFRGDLYFRLSVILVRVPPLRDRPEDIPLLVSLFLKRYEKDHRLSGLKLEAAAMERLKSYPWPGNVRELDNTLLRAAITCQAGVIRDGDLLLEERMGASGSVTTEAVLALDQVEKDKIFQALEAHRGNRTHAAKALGISLSTLKNKLRKYRATGASE